MQEGLHSQELERLVQQIQKLEAMVVGREAEAVQRSQDQERMHRLHPAAEVPFPCSAICISISSPDTCSVNPESRAGYT